MSTSLQFTLTNAGIAAAFNAQNTGFNLAITHMQIGSGNKVPDKTELALVTPQQKTTIAAGYSVAGNQKRMTGIFGGASSFSINEIGIWAGDPDAGGTLFGYWSQATGQLTVKSSGVDFVFSHDMFLDSSFPGASITITVDGTFPPESFTQVQADTLYDPLGGLSAHIAALNPHPQYSKVIAWITKSTNYTAQKSQGIFVDTFGQAVTITLPLSPVVGDLVFFEDLRGTFGKNALIVGRNGGNIMGLAEDMIVTKGFIAFELVYSGATYGWRIL